jgi:myo-inositol-1(or 4)-monophosphatase
MTDRHRLLEQAEHVIMTASETLVRMQGTQLRAQRKTLRDIVTEADLASERMIIEGLRRLTPNCAILSEEAGASGPIGGPRWIIDPLDGTVNYAAGLPWFSVTVAYQQNSETELGVAHAPAAGMIARYIRGELATVNDTPARVSRTKALDDAVVSVVLGSHLPTADVHRTAAVIRRLGETIRGVRVVVSGALELSLVAAGHLDAFVSLKADIVSHAAAMPLVRAAGGRVTTLDGRDARDEDEERIASNDVIHEDLLRCLREALR